jgi:hypothetical protein
MFEKLLLAAAITVSLQIFAGVSNSPKLPENHVFRSLLVPVETQKLPLVATPSPVDRNVES